MKQSMPETSAPGGPQGPGASRQAAPRRILVLGAGGFIGQRVVRALAASDWALPVAATHRHAVELPRAIPTVRLDARDAGALGGALAGAAGVVNCITGDAPTILASARALFAACAGAGAPRIVHLSTMMVYGSAQGMVDERAPLLGDWDDYSAAKAQVETMARACPDVVHLRPGIVYGPGSALWSASIGRWLRAGRLGDLGAAGGGLCNLVHVDDVVAAVLSALRLPGIEGEAFNLSLPAAPTWNEYFRAYAAALGRPARPVSGGRLQRELRLYAPPLKLLQVAAGALRLAWRPPEPIRPWLLRLCRHGIGLDVRKAERVLGLHWRPLDEGLRETAAWFMAAARGGVR